MKKKAIYIFIAFIAVALAAVSAYIIDDIKSRREPAFMAAEAQEPQIPQSPQMRESGYAIGEVIAKERSMAFDDGSVFTILRFEFPENAGLFTYDVPIAGDSISMRWQNYGDSPYTWEIADVLDAPKATLFAETTEESVVLSIPALYYSRFPHNTIENIPELERAAKIIETNGGYVFRMEFEPVADTVGELWYYKREGALADWDDETEKMLLRQDLHKDRRFCYDGYHYRTYESYEPYAENGFFRNAANFTGAQLLESETGARNLGYAMTKICLLNQNPRGYWETGPMSKWLYNDYGIGYGFYDTRFSTDFARSLLDGYSLYGDIDFLDAAEKYAEFLTDYAEREGYTGGALGEGLLVPDYWSMGARKKTHVSLNHQLAEINFLLEIFMLTGEQKYKSCAERMLLGIENTYEEWILDDKNLRYALMYEESSNNMEDYPYLTYNDLFDTRLLLEALNEQSAAVNALMASKKEWMDANGVTGYRE